MKNIKKLKKVEGREENREFFIILLKKPGTERKERRHVRYV